MNTTENKSNYPGPFLRFAILMLLGLSLQAQLVLAIEREWNSAPIVDQQTMSQWGYQSVQNQIYNVNYCDEGSNIFPQFSLAESTYQAVTNEKGYRMVLIRERYPNERIAAARIVHLKIKRNSRFNKMCGLRKIFLFENTVYMVHTDWIQVWWNALPGIFIKLQKYVTETKGRSSDSKVQNATDYKLHAAVSIMPNSRDWKKNYDFDGDGIKDTIWTTYSGGANCCYLIKIKLTSSNKVYSLPFELDGGYLRGLDLSQPDRFDVRTNQRGLTEMVMQIQTYNGKNQPIPSDWKTKYGIRTHYIAVGFSGGELVVRDYSR